MESKKTNTFGKAARKIIGGLFVCSLGLGLHFTLRSLNHELPRQFPQLEQEKRIDSYSIPNDMTLDDAIVEDQSSTPPAESIAVKLAGEAPGESLQKLDRSLKSSKTNIDTKPDNKIATKNVRRLVTATTLPAIKGPSKQISQSFEVPADLIPIVSFWEKVYGVYTSEQIMVHDSDYLDIEYAVLDFKELNKSALPDSQKRAQRESIIRKANQDIRDSLTELEESDGKKPLSQNALRIEALFKNIKDPKKYKNAKEAIRTQIGLKDRFLAGFKHSGRYMALFEEIFQSYGIPKEVSRLTFVESLLNERAYSKVGAAGLWQFMPDTAKHYMAVNSLVDERYDPIVATHGAARLLLKNYQTLGSWPLAINAYNSGAGNLLKAIAKLGTRDIGSIITRYKSGSYAFASRNFYPSFLAALDVYEHSEKFFGKITKEASLQFETIELPATMGFAEIASFANVSLDDLKRLNPAFSATVFTGNYAMPLGTQIRLSTGHEQTFAMRFLQNSPMINAFAPSKITATPNLVRN